MPLNDQTGSEFDTSLADESTYPTPATEIGFVAQRRHIAVDRGSGSYAEDGPIEVAEGTISMDGEQLLGAAASMEGQSEIGDDLQSPFESFMMDEMRVGGDNLSEIGDGFTPYEIGGDNLSEIGGVDNFSEIGEEEIGSNAMYGPTEIGKKDTDWMHPAGPGNWLHPDHPAHPAHPDHPDHPPDPTAHPVLQVVETARNARQPAPPMRAVSPEAAPPARMAVRPLVRTMVGAAMASGNPDPFPLTAQFMQRCGADITPRFVRVDTEDSYKGFRTEHSPELSELAARVSELEGSLHAHLQDPDAHGSVDHGALAEDMEDLTVLGAQAHEMEDEKRIDLWMPKRYDGLVTAWREGDFVCASMTLPGQDGELRICTSMEPVVKCVTEMSHYAAKSGADAKSVVGVLSAMGCVLGAGTVLKEMAAAAPSIMNRPEAAHKAPFVVRIEPKTNPAIAALALLAMACKTGDQQACFEWENLAKLSPAPVKQAMAEALALAKAAGA